jgi:membrane protease YdiL (CAAX protease family)
VTQPPPPGHPAPPPPDPVPPSTRPAAGGRRDDATTGERWPELPDGWWRGTLPHATFPVPFSATEGLLVAAWGFFGQVVIGGILGIGLALLGLDLLGDSVLTYGFSIGVMLLVFGTGLLYLKLRGRLTWRLWGPVRPKGVHVLWGLLAGVFGVLVIQLGVGLILTLLGETDPPQQSVVEGLSEGGTATILIIVLAVVLAPIIEEVFFRGVWFQGLRRSVGLWPAAIITSLGFGVVHVEVIETVAIPAVLVAVVLLVVAVIPPIPLPVRLVAGAMGLAAAVYAISLGGFASVLLPGALAALGLLFALAFHRTGSLVVPIVGHAAFNGIVVTLALYADRIETLA